MNERSSPFEAGRPTRPSPIPGMPVVGEGGEIATTLDRVMRAWHRREGAFPALRGADAPTDAIRIVHGSSDRVPGLYVDRFGDTLVVLVKDGIFAGELDAEAWADFFLAQTPIRSAYLKQVGVDRSGEGGADEAGRFAPEPWFGEARPEAIEAREDGLKFEVQPWTGFHPGLFLDQRHHRAFFRAATQAGHRVLNLFAHTGSFSVACAAAGADTTSVDTSGRYLDWAKRNFVRNDLLSDRQRFFKADATFFLERSAKRGERYDLVILDPPSFSRGPNGKFFRIQKDIPALMELAAEVVAPKGTLFVSTNFEELWPSRLRRLAPGKAEDELQLPPRGADFPPGEFSIHALAWTF